VKRQKGQTLLLFALTLFLLALMVMVTLGIGMRTRERVEAQMVSDAAAYSNAVTAARTFNTIAVLNRGQIAYMVAMAGTQSLISYAGAIRSGINSTRQALGMISVLSVSSCPALSAAASVAAAGANAQNTALQGAWEPLDQAAGMQAKGLQGVGGLNGMQKEMYGYDSSTGFWNQGTGTPTNVLNGNGMMAYITNQKLTKDIAKLAKTDLKAVNAGDDKSVSELATTYGSPGGAAYIPEKVKQHDISAVMGSRGYDFVTSRAGASGPLRARLDLVLNSVAPAASFVTVTDSGGSGFGGGRESSQTTGGISGLWSWADDHVNVQVLWVGCGIPFLGAGGDIAFVQSTEQQDSADQHQYQGGSDAVPELVRHTMGPCARCPGIWPFFVDYNQDSLQSPTKWRADKPNDYGQPKMYSILERDYSARSSITPGGNGDPWNLRFNFAFDTGTPGTEFDNGSLKGDMKTRSGDSLKRQVVVSAGIAYYHRPYVAATGGGGFKEPPNFLNPFWRATLVPVDDDIDARLDSAGYAEHADLVRALRGGGTTRASYLFKGWQ
jgi:hypothetical protein